MREKVDNCNGIRHDISEKYPGALISVRNAFPHGQLRQWRIDLTPVIGRQKYRRIHDRREDD